MSFRYQQLTDDLGRQIEQGTLQAGERLPGVRALARLNGVSVSTAVTAYQELEARGLVEARPRSGYFVTGRGQGSLEPPRSVLAEPYPSRISGAELALRFTQMTADASVIHLGATVPDPALQPHKAIEKALRQSLREAGDNALNYAFPPGLETYRLALARRMSRVGCSVQPADILVTSGCQEAITLALRATTEPGDLVAVESPTYYGVLQILESLGLKALEIPTHYQSGLSIEALQLALEQWPVKACVVIPHFNNPSGFCMPDTHKERLVALLARHEVPLIEDDIYGDMSWQGERPKPCKHWDKDGGVIYCSSFSKSLSPGMRTGWMTPGRWQRRLEYLKYVTNLASPTLPQLAMTQLLERGLYDRHLKLVQREYAQTARRLQGILRHAFPPGTRVTQPQGGLVLWVELPFPVAGLSLANEALAAGISVAPGALFATSDKYANHLRLACSHRWTPAVEAATYRLAELVRRFSGALPGGES